LKKKGYMAKKYSKEEPTILTKSVDTFEKELRQRIEIGNTIISTNISDFTELSLFEKKFYHWDDVNNELIKRSFNNPHSEYFDQYSNLNKMAGVMDALKRVNTQTLDYKRNLEKRKIENCINWLERLIEKLPLIDSSTKSKSSIKTPTRKQNTAFIVHGHDDAKKFEVARFLESDLTKKAIILHEQANRGKTIIEKFETFSEVDFAIAIWSADDLGKAKDEDDLSKRARQNVVFETGFFIGKLGRQNVIVLHEDGVELPSDYSGVIFISFHGNWKHELAKEIKEIYNYEL
jgi:predicted nucleotide-binding protein